MTTKKAATPEVTGVNFLNPDFYTGGGGIPPGPYALEFFVQMFQAKDKTGRSNFDARLGVRVRAHSLTDPDKRGDNAYEQFYSMGTDAHKSFQPNPHTGKSLVAVPGGPASTLPRLTNWDVLLKSLYDSGLPAGIAINDISVLDGVHVTMSQIPEPEERKSFATPGNEADTQRKGGGRISVVSEIHEDGKPWEGTGGIPGVETDKGQSKSTGKAVTTISDKSTKPAADKSDEQDVLTAATSAASDVLNSINPVTKKSNLEGMTHLAFRTGMFSLVRKTYGDDMAQAVADTYFGSTDAVNELLNSHGYESDGKVVSPAK
jgi:hypothetical protein